MAEPAAQLHSRSRMVNVPLRTFVGSRETAAAYERRMTRPYIHGRTALADASDLIELYGEHARLEAAERAARSRGDGNVMRFCHWRQIERVIAVLGSEVVSDTVH